MLERLKRGDVARFPTPCMFFCERPMREALDRMRTGVAAEFPGTLHIRLSVKCCYRLPVLRSLCSAGVGAEVMSENEYALARAAGIPGPRIVCNGLGRPDAYLRRASKEGACVVIDCADDLRALLRTIDKEPVSIGMRVQPDLTHHPASPYSAVPHKLGLVRGSQEWDAVLRLVVQSAHVKVEMLAVHMASVECENAIYRDVLGQLSELGYELRSKYGIILQTIDLGGGFAGFRNDNRAGFERLFQGIGSAFAAHFPDDTALMLEPGRYLVESAAYVCATVLAVKMGPDRAYLVTDAGTNALLPHREAAYVLAEPPGQPSGRHRVSVVDGITSVNAVIIRDTWLDELPRPGDTIWLANCGAYTTAMGGFWAYDPIPVVFVDVHDRLVRDLDRETIATARRLVLGI